MVGVDKGNDYEMLRDLRKLLGKSEVSLTTLYIVIDVRCYPDRDDESPGNSGFSAAGLGFSLHYTGFAQYGVAVGLGPVTGVPLPLRQYAEGRLAIQEKEKAMCNAENIHVRDGEFYFDYVHHDGKISDIHLGIPGVHNVENAVAAITASRLLSIADAKIVKALSTFKGVKRRFEYIVRSPQTIYIDDYAHHPEELRAFISSMRKLYPAKKLTVVFQPHLFSRTRDFVDGFAEVLAMADELLLMEIYPARELPIEGVTSTWLADKIALENKRVVSPQEVLNIIKEEKPELVVTVGAGDIDRLIKPLKAILNDAQ
ncbi:hypothetical protein FQR65_LT15171 [Abscondita terminalis]|nr:hypothetical protein FQR65_LT15171 [Abscondita terminalis]